MDKKLTQSLPRRWPRSTMIIKQEEIDFKSPSRSSQVRRPSSIYIHKKSKSLDLRDLARFERESNEEFHHAGEPGQRSYWSKLCLHFTPRRFGWTPNLEWRSNTKYEGRMILIGDTEVAAQSPSPSRVPSDPSKIQMDNFVSNAFKSSKYTLFNFIPYNLVQQFRRAANVYFLIALLLTILLPDAPLDPASWMLSLIFVISITMIKQGYEDYLRHKKDRITNEREVNVVRQGELKTLRSQEIQVGDIIRLTENETVPSDIVVLSSSHEGGQAYAMTANLDGETSLKTKYSCSLTKYLRTLDEINNLRGVVECEVPNPKIDSFVGRLTLIKVIEGQRKTEEESVSLNQSNLLMASTQLKNTKEVLGLCVFTGEQTKMSLNSRITKNKFSVVEKTLNKFLIFYGVIMVLQILVSTILSMHFGFEYSTVRDQIYNKYNIDFHDNDDEWYIGQVLDVNLMAWIITALIWFTLFNFYIPISLYVTLEFQKMVSSRLYRRDMSYYDSSILCNSSDVNEDLGLVTHLFTDKTGTLTTNVMTFRKYVDESGRVGTDLEEEEGIWNPFLMILTMCHSAQIESEHFVASSPDEKALLEACRRGGYDYLGESMDGIISIQTRDQRVRKYRKLDELEFDSFRKCMSVIVQCEETSKIFVLSKGAETAMGEIICNNYSDVVKALMNEFAEEGLRTLVLGFRTLSTQEYEDFHSKSEHARSAVIEINRSKYMREAYELVERNLTYAGITGIEDRLQEDLPETLEAIREAGIMIWMLTGDKRETALNIGQSSGLIPKGSNTIDLCNVGSERDMSMLISSVYDRQVNSPSSNTLLVIDGKLLSYIFKNDSSKKHFSYLLATVTTVIACRLSPIQKSLLVRMVKKFDLKNFVTAAIGDGGNDISMIQEAHVGFGIIGLEGKGASRAADFAFSKFKFLRRTLLIHGYWFYDRVAYVIQYSFYKNVVCFFCQFLIAFYSNFSATSLYNGTFIMCFNTAYTAIPVLAFGLFERRESEETLWNNPGSYLKNVGNKQLKAIRLVSWFFLGVWQAFIIFYGWLLAWPNMEAFGIGDIFCFGTLISETTVLVTNFQILFDIKYFDPKIIFSIIFSLVGFGVITMLIQRGFVPFFNEANEYGVYETLFLSLPKWVISVLIVLSCLLPKFFGRSTYYFLVANEEAIKKTIKKTVRFDLSMSKV